MHFPLISTTATTTTHRPIAAFGSILSLNPEAGVVAERDLRYLGEDRFEHLAADPCGHDLKSSQDVTSTILIPKREKSLGPCLDSATVALQKAAVAGFQCWNARNPGIVGLLVGVKQKQGGRTACTTVVVGKQWKELLQDPQVASLCEQESAYLCGVMLGASSTQDDTNRACGHEHLRDLWNLGHLKAICVFVAWPNSGTDCRCAWWHLLI